MSFKIDWRWCCLLLLGLWFWPSLVPHDPWKPDESYILGLIYEYTLRDNWLVPMLSGEPFMEKPPLFFWTAAAFSRYVFTWLPIHMAARLAAAFYIGLTLLFAALAAGEFAARSRMKNPASAAWLTAVLLAGTLGLVGNGHHILTDSALFASFALALYALAVFPVHPLRSGLLLGTAWGMSFMTKGLLGPGSLGLAAALLPLVDPLYRKKSYLLTLSLAFWAAMPWWLIWPWRLWLASPELFHAWFWVNNLGRFLGQNNLGPEYERGFYLKNMPWHAFPLILYLPVLFFRQRMAVLTTATPAAVLCILTYFILSMARTSMELYAVPALVAFSVWMGSQAAMVPAVFERRFGRVALGLMVITAGVLWWAWAALYFGLPLQARLMHFVPGFVARPEMGMVVAALVLTLAVFYLAKQAAGSEHEGALRWLALLVLAYGLVFSLLLPALNYSKSYRPLMVDLAQQLDRQQCLASFGVGEHERGNFHYYTGIRAQRLEIGQGKACPQLFIQGSSRPDNIAEYQQVKTAVRPVNKGEEFTIWQKISR